MSEVDRRSAKLHKQTEVDDDSEEGIQTPSPPHSTTTSTIASQSSGVLCKNLCNIPSPTIVQASSCSSETSPEDPTPKPPLLPATPSRKQTLTRTPAFEGTSPPPESFLVHHKSSPSLLSSDHSSSSATTATIISSGSSNGSRSIIPSISTTSPPFVTTSTPPFPNGGTVTVNTLSITPNTVFTSTGGSTKGTSTAHQAKEFMLASHTVSNDSGRGTLDDSSDFVPRESNVDPSFNLATAATSSLLASAATSSSLTSLSTPTSTILSLAYTDSTGTDLIPFFKSTLRKSAKDKKMLLAVEKEIIAFIGDQGSQSHKMNEMNPYDRMVAHRVAAYYGLDHNVDQSGKCIIVTRTVKTRLPDVKLCDMTNTLEEKRILLKKPSSLDEQQVKRLTTKDKFGTNRAKSLEERQQNYHEVRERIFKVEEGSMVNKEGQTTSFSSGNLLQHPSFQQHHHRHPPISQQRSLDSMRDARQQQQQQQHCTPHPHLHQHQSFSHLLWSSTDSSGYESIGGPSLYESPPSQQSTNPELSDTPTGSVRDQSPASRPASETGQSPLTQFSQYPTVTYLVPTDLALKHPGNCVINPETMQPHANPDGALFQYDVSCPPPIIPASFVYQADPSYDLTSRLAGTSLAPVDSLVAGGLDQMSLGPGQTVSLLQSPGHTSNFVQTQYINGSQTLAQPVRYIYSLPPTAGGGSVGTPIHQHRLTTTPTTGLDSTHHPIHQGHPHQVTTVVTMPPTAASPVIPPVFTPTGAVAAGGSYQIINHPTAYIQTASGLSGVNVSVTPIPASATGMVGGSIPIDLSSLTPEQQGALAAGSGAVVCNPNLSHPTVVNHPQSIQQLGEAAPAHPPAAAAIPISTPNVIQAYALAPYHLTNVATLPIAQQRHQQQLQQQQQQHLLQHQQSSLTQHPHHQHVQNHHHSSTTSITAIPPCNNLTSIPPTSSLSSATFFPLTNTNNSPSPLSQSQHLQQHPPPPQVPPPPHQLQQPTMLYNIGGVPMISTLTPTSSSLSLPPPSLLLSKSNLAASTSSAGQFSTPPPPPHQPTPPPGAPTMQSYHYHTQQQQQQKQQQPPPPQHQQYQSSSATSSSSSSNGYQHYHYNQSHHYHSNDLQVHPSYSQSPSAITFIPNQSLSSQQLTTQQGGIVASCGNNSPQLVTIPNAAGGSGYHPQFRPVGTIVPMPGVPGVPSAATTTPTQFQVVRPTGPVQDFRMLQPGAFHTRLPSISLYAPLMYHQSRPRIRPGKGSKKYGSRDLGNGQGSGNVHQPQQQEKENPLSQHQSSFAPPQLRQQQQQVVASNSQANCSSVFYSPLLPPASCRP